MKVTYTGTGGKLPSEKKSPTVAYVGTDRKNGGTTYQRSTTGKAGSKSSKKQPTVEVTKSAVPSINALGAGDYGADKTPNKGYNYGKGAAKAGLTSLGNIAQMVSTPLSQLERLTGKGIELVTGQEQGKGLFERWDDSIKAEQQAVAEKYRENTEAGGEYAEKLEGLTQSVFEALPSLGVALATGGGSAATKAADLAARTAGKTGLAATAKQGAKTLLKDPNFITSAMQIYSGSYNNAKADGASELQAAAYALANAGLGGYVEIQGGLQKLPKVLQGDETFLKALAKTMLEEGAEEVEQGVIDRALQRIGYGADNPLLGFGENGIIDPAAALEEFAGGAIVGGLLGGGTMAVDAALNKAHNRSIQRNADTIAAEEVAETPAVEYAPTSTQNVPVDMPTAIAPEVQVSTVSKPTTASYTQKTGLGENGQAAYHKAQQEYGNSGDLYAGFAAHYDAGLAGISPTMVQSRVQLPEGVRGAAYEAGLKDATAKLAQENAAVKRVTTSKGAGLSNNEYAAMLAKKAPQKAAVLNTIGKDLGMRIELVESVKGGEANGQYLPRSATAQIAVDAENPLEYVAAHESTHRMQELAPDEYNVYRKAAVEHYAYTHDVDVAEAVELYRKAAAESGVELTHAEAMDEIAADYTDRLMGDADLFKRFATEHRTAAQKLLDALKEFVAKVKRALKGKARDAAAQETYGTDFATLQEIAKKWQDAFDAAAEQAASIDSTIAEQGDTVYMDDMPRFSLIVTDKDALDFLNKQETIKTYKTMQVVDGKLYPPMASRIKGKHEDASELGKWEMSVEHPELVDDKGSFLLDKGKGNGSIKAAYAPYMHSSNLVLNDQFSGAYKRDNLVTVECEVPVSEQTSGYRAEKAKKGVGWHPWHTGTVASAVRAATGVERKVFLSRWIKPVRIVPDAEVAEMYKELVDGHNIAIPDNVVPPSLLSALRDAGVPIKESGRVTKYQAKNAETATKENTGLAFDLNKKASGRQKAAMQSDVSTGSVPDASENVKEKFSLKNAPAVDSTGRELSEQQREYFKDSKVRDAEGRLLKLYHQTEGGFTVFDPNNAGAGRSDGETPFGIFLKSSSRDIGLRGKTQMELYANITNPLYAENREDLSRKVGFLSPEYARIEQEHRALDAEYGTKVEAAKREWVSFITEWRKDNPNAPRDALYDVPEFNRLFDAEDSIIQEWTERAGALSSQAKETITNALREGGYDGVILKNDKGSFGRDTDAFIALDPAQVKNVDNTTPTSSPDIRYQLKSARDVEQELQDLKRERTILKSRNKVLEERVAKWRGEVHRTKTPVAVEKDVKRLGLDTIRRYNSDAKYSDIREDLTALANAVMQKDVTMNDLMPHAKAAAETIVNNTQELTEYGAELLEIKEYLKHQKIKFDGNMNNYNDFRKAHRGTLKLNKSEGLPVDTAYSELSEMFGEGYFPSDLYTEADKVQRIGDVLGGVDAIYENPFSPYHDAAVQEIANELIDGAISEQVRQKKTYADRMEFEKQEAVAARVQTLLKRERATRKRQLDRMRDKFEERLAEYRAERDDKEKQLRSDFAERQERDREKREAAGMRSRISRHTAALSQKLLHPTDKQHIPESLRKPVAALLESINLESAYTYGADGKRHKNDKGDPTRRTLQAVELRRAYRKILDGEENISVDPALLEDGGLLEQLEDYSNKRIADMNTSELTTVWQAIRAIESSINSYNRSLSAARYAYIDEWAGRIKEESSTRRRRNRGFTLDMVDPYTFFSAYGEAGMQIYRTLRNAQDKEHLRVQELKRKTKDVLNDKVYKERLTRHEYTTERGATLTLTTEQIMNLHNLARRGEQAMNHLLVGGIVQPEIARNGKLHKIARGDTENGSIHLTEQDIQNLVGKLTPEQKKVADGLQKAASTLLAEWGNEASMAVYGYRKFTEGNYWPIQVASDALSSDISKGEDLPKSIKNMGSAKALMPNATSALELRGVYDVFSKNASDMIKYSTLLAPMEDINRLYNFRFRNERGNLTGLNMKHVLSRVYGDKAQEYWRNLMRDMQNGMRLPTSETTKAVGKITSDAKSAAVGANLRVVIQQPTAYIRAAAILDPDNMAKGLTGGVTNGNGWDKARKWSPIASIKDTGGFDQGGRYTVAKELYGTDSKLEKLNDMTSWAAAKADAVTWGKIWNACEWQVAEDTSLTKGSDEFYSEVARVFTEVIDQSQVADGIMQRTQVMRDPLARQAMPFMGEPLKTANMLMRSYDAWKYETDPKKRGRALNQLKRTVFTVAVTDVVNALAQSIVDAWRDDDKERGYFERLMQAFTGYDPDEDENLVNVLVGGNIASNVNPIGRVPYLKDILSIVQGYTVDRMDAGVFDDLYSAIKAFNNAAEGNGKKTVAYSVKQLISATAKVFGISVTNAGRDIWGIARTIADSTGNVRLMYEMEKAIYRIDKTAGNRKRWCELLKRAQDDGDRETARYIYKDMLNNGYEEKDIKNGMESLMKKEQGVTSVEDLKKRWSPPY